MTNLVRLKCFQEGKKLRIKIISSGYVSVANCRFPRDIRVKDREYTVPRNDITMVHSKYGYFYSIRKANIQIIESDIIANFKNLKVYSDEDNASCAICLDDEDVELVIFVPCGHQYTCSDCASKLKKTCPICRGIIQQVITRTQLQL